MSAWDPDWAAQRAAEAMRYLADHYPECSGADELDPYHHAVHDAAMTGDRDTYEAALREYMLAGRRIALEKRKGAA